MKKLFIILTASLFLNFFSIKSWAYDCSEYAGVPEITFSTSYGRLRYDFSKTNKNITAIARRHNIIETGLFAQGLALVNVKFNLELMTITADRGDYDICVVPRRLNVFIGFNDPVIYISKELTPDSCEYNVVLRHEQTHQQINKASLDYFIPLFQDAVEKIAASIPPQHVTTLSDVSTATDELTAQYERKIKPLIAVFRDELLTEQGKLDNTANYEHENRLCR